MTFGIVARRLVMPCFSILALALSGCGGGGVKSGLSVTIEATPDQGAYPLAVTLKARVGGQPASADATYEWDLGDETLSTEAEPVHTYAAVGEYVVTLKLTVGSKVGNASKTIVVADVGAGTDLAVEAIDVTPLSVNPGAPVTVKVTLRNRGTTAFEHSFINRIYITTADVLVVADETPRGTINMPGIAGGESVDKTTSITIPASFALANYNVFVVLDASEAVDELDETNNVAKGTTPLTVTSASLPVDLTASVPTVSAASVAGGANVTVDTILENLGATDAGQFRLKVMLSADPIVDADDLEIHDVQIASLAGNSTAPQSLVVAIPADVDNRPWYLGVIVDPDSEVSETNETNNAANLAGLLTTTGGTGCTEDANEPNETQLTATVVAAGTMPLLQVCGDTTDWFKMDLGMGDRLTSVINFQNVNGNLDLAVFKMGVATPVATSATSQNVEQVESGVALTAGTYFVRVTMGGTSTGNVYDLVATLEDNGGPGIDLMPAAIVIANGAGTPVPPGMPATADVSLYNFGDVAATAFDVELYLSTNKTLEAGDTLLDTFNVTGIAAGMNAMSSRSVTFPAATPSGYYYVIAKVDSGSVQTENHETNNLLAVKVGIGNGCIDDAFETNNSIATATVMDNGTYLDVQMCTGLEANGDIYAISTGAGGTIEVTVSDLASDLDIDLKLVNASDAIPSDCTTANNMSDCSTAAGGGTSETVRYTAATGGTFYVKAFGWQSGDTGSYTLTVSGSTGSMPDFAPSGVVASPSAIVAGDDLQVDGFIKNNSTQATAAFDWAIRLSSDATIDGGDLMLYTSPETALNAAENRPVGHKVFVPETVAGGTYYVGLVADTGNVVVESSETNNAAVTATKVTIAANCNDDSFEENDTFASASMIAIGGTIADLAICSTDADFYRITPASSGTLTIHADFIHSTTGDIDMRVLNPTQSSIASSTSVNDDEDISVAVTGGVTYRIKVYGFSGSVQFQSNSYTLTTTLTP